MLYKEYRVYKIEPLDQRDPGFNGRSGFDNKPVITDPELRLVNQYINDVDFAVLEKRLEQYARSDSTYVILPVYRQI